MKTKLIIMPLTICAMSLFSCNKSGINRNVYKEASFEDALKVHEKIIANQTNEDITTLFDNGSIVNRHKLELKGKPRVQDISYHDVDLNISAGFNIYWSLDKNYLKVEGEQEDDYYVEKDGKYYHLESYLLEGETKKEKTDITDDVNYYESFRDYLVEKINFYSTITVPFVFNLTSGITGDSCYISFPFETYFDICPNTFFDEELKGKLDKISQKYKDENKGNYLNLTYGIDNDTSVCFTMKGKGVVNDFTDPTLAEHGTLEIDNFMSWKDNFISQYEMNFSASGINIKKINANMSVSLYVSSETTQGNCVPDSVDPDSF